VEELDKGVLPPFMSCMRLNTSPRPTPNKAQGAFQRCHSEYADFLGNVAEQERIDLDKLDKWEKMRNCTLNLDELDDAIRARTCEVVSKERQSLSEGFSELISIAQQVSDAEAKVNSDIKRLEAEMQMGKEKWEVEMRRSKEMLEVEAQKGKDMWASEVKQLRTVAQQVSDTEAKVNNDIKRLEVEAKKYKERRTSEVEQLRTVAQQVSDIEAKVNKDIKRLEVEAKKDKERRTSEVEQLRTVAQQVSEAEAKVSKDIREMEVGMQKGKEMLAAQVTKDLQKMVVEMRKGKEMLVEEVNKDKKWWAAEAQQLRSAAQRVSESESKVHTDIKKWELEMEKNKKIFEAELIEKNKEMCEVVLQKRREEMEVEAQNEKKLWAREVKQLWEKLEEIETENARLRATITERNGQDRLAAENAGQLSSFIEEENENGDERNHNQLDRQEPATSETPLEDNLSMASIPKNTACEVPGITNTACTSRDAGASCSLPATPRKLKVWERLHYFGLPSEEEKKRHTEAWSLRRQLLGYGAKNVPGDLKSKTAQRRTTLTAPPGLIPDSPRSTYSYIEQRRSLMRSSSMKEALMTGQSLPDMKKALADMAQGKSESLWSMRKSWSVGQEIGDSSAMGPGAGLKNPTRHGLTQKIKITGMPESRR